MSAALPKLRHPVVLAHGLMGFARIAVGGVEMATYFRGIPERLRKSGIEVHTPEVPPAGSIARRATALRDAVRTAAGRGKVHLVAHSMGGLDARHMITHLGMDERVLSLTTLGTPHRGSPVADVVIDLAGKLGLLGLVRSAGESLAALEDLSTARCGAFDEATPDVPGVVYMAVAGSKDRSRVHAALRATFSKVFDAEGANDGLVSVRSASRWPGVEVWDADHVDMIGWGGTGGGAEAETGREVDVRVAWARLVARLASLE